MKLTFFSLILILLICFKIQADVSVSHIFKSDMVLQRDTVIFIWGWGDAGEEVYIKIGNDQYSGKAEADGRWRIAVGPYKAGGPFTITIAGNNEIVLQNVLFGEVWLCGGQSNMQYTLRWLGKNLDEIPHINNDSIRLFQAQLNTDYLPADNLKGGSWKIASKETVPEFSAVAYFFGKLLYDSLKVPIGLISINQGATSIETWMSKEALKPFDQYKPIIDKIEKTNKNFNQLQEDLIEFRKEWDPKFYMVGPGFEQKWYQSDLDVSDWNTMTIPDFWENQGIEHDGAVWFRKKFDLPKGFDSDTFLINLNQIDDYDITWINGIKVGETFGNRNFRTYKVPSSVLKKTGNDLVVRVFDIGGVGGMYTNAFWGNPILLGEWKYKIGLKINPDEFAVPEVPNGSFFSYPTLLYNGNIAPVSQFAIKGVIWYQGEANVGRAQEYGALLPAMVRDWRNSWGYNFPFLIVQLANYGKEPEIPEESDWAELREAQGKARKEPNVFLATAIDIGEADDIHPHNKEEVGRRLGIGALKIAYGYNIMANSPEFKKFTIIDNKARIDFNHTGSGLVTRNKFGFVHGFQIAGADKKFYWAKAEISGNQVLVSSPYVKKPVSVRYAWANNPGKLDLYNKEGLPVLPFRTDNWPMSTAGRVYIDDPHQF